MAQFERVASLGKPLTRNPQPATLNFSITFALVLSAFLRLVGNLVRLRSR